jgi:hypothetical protein
LEDTLNGTDNISRVSKYAFGPLMAKILEAKEIRVIAGKPRLLVPFGFYLNRTGSGKAITIRPTSNITKISSWLGGKKKSE